MSRCDRCGGSPAWPVVWEVDGREVDGEMLCAACDEAEQAALEADLEEDA